MTPKQLHMGCDFFLFLPFIGIVLSVFLSTNKLDQDIFIIKQIFSNWKNKPIHIIQDSYQKQCSEIGMNDVILYEWPGTKNGCVCNNQTPMNGRCVDSQIKVGCKYIDEIYAYNAKKWKGRYLCSSNVKFKSYFELNKVKANEECSYRYKKCGVLDTLGNILCMPEAESCPINEFNFINTVDAQNVRINTSNNNLSGKIFTNFNIAEEHLCINSSEKEFFEVNYPLLDNKNNKLFGCSTFAVSSEGNKFNYDTSSIKLDTYQKKVFYENNGIFPYVSQTLPHYPSDITTNISLYGNVYTGWKKICEKREFNQFMSNSTDQEILEIVKSTNEYNPSLYCYTLALIIVFVGGVVFLKYSRILFGNYKIDISQASLIIIILVYSTFIVINAILLYIADVNLDVIKNAKITYDFFEFLNNNECSDSYTNAVLKQITKEFFNYLNRYFNIKILSVMNILFSLMILSFTIFSRNSYDMNRKNSKKRGFLKSD